MVQEHYYGSQLNESRFKCLLWFSIKWKSFHMTDAEAQGGHEPAARPRARALLPRRPRHRRAGPHSLSLYI